MRSRRQQLAAASAAARKQPLGDKVIAMHPHSSKRKTSLSALLNDVEGATAVEYGLIAALVTVGLIGALRNVREALFALPLGTLSEVFAAVLS